MTSSSSSSSSKLYITLIIMTGLVVGYIAYSQWISSAEAVISPPAINNQDSLANFKKIKIDFNVLDASAYKSLITSGESPVNPGVTGKKDIFAP